MTALASYKNPARSELYLSDTPASAEAPAASADTASHEQPTAPAGTPASPVVAVGRHVAVPALLSSFCKCAGRAFTPDPYEPQTLQLFSPGKQHLRLTLPAASANLLGERMCVDEYTESSMMYVMVGCTSEAIDHYRSTGSCDGLVVTLDGQTLRHAGLISREGRIRRCGVRLSDADALEQALKLCCELRFDHDTKRKCDESGQRLDHYRMDRFPGVQLLSDYKLERNGRDGLKYVQLFVSRRFVEYLLATGSMSRRNPKGFILDDRIFAMRRGRGGKGANHHWRIARWAIVQLNLHATDLAHGSTNDPFCRREVNNLLEYCPELDAQRLRNEATRRKKRQHALLQRLLREVGEALDLVFIPYKNKEDKDMLIIARVGQDVSSAFADPGTASDRDHGLDGARSGLDGARRRISSSNKRKNRRRRR